MSSQLKLDESKQTLKCSQRHEGTVFISLDDIYSLNDNLRDSNFFNTLHKSLAMYGMKNPILVCSDEDFKNTDIRTFERRNVLEDISETYRCMIGNNRYKYAVDNGYTHIECIVVTSLNELKMLHRQTEIPPSKMMKTERLK